MAIGRGNRSTQRKPEAVPLCFPKVPHDHTRARTRVSAGGSSDTALQDRLTRHGLTGSSYRTLSPGGPEYARRFCVSSGLQPTSGPGIDPWSGHVGFVVDEGHWGMFPPSTSVSPANSHPTDCSTIRGRYCRANSGPRTEWTQPHAIFQFYITLYWDPMFSILHDAVLGPNVPSRTQNKCRVANHAPSTDGDMMSPMLLPGSKWRPHLNGSL
jgi:hypothetical protein